MSASDTVNTMHSHRATFAAIQSSGCPSRRTLIGAVLAGVLAGCSALPLSPEQNQVLRSWRGRYALNAIGADNNAQNSSGNFLLTETRNLTHFELLSPLGATLASAQFDDKGAILLTADGRRFEAASAEALTEQLFGWRVPVQRLPDWFEGKVARIVSTQADRQGQQRPFEAEEAGWSIRFEVWNGDRIGRIVVRYPDRVELRMVIADAL